MASRKRKWLRPCAATSWLARNAPTNCRAPGDGIRCWAACIFRPTDAAPKKSRSCGGRSPQNACFPRFMAASAWWTSARWTRRCALRRQESRGEQLLPSCPGHEIGSDVKLPDALKRDAHDGRDCNSKQKCSCDGGGQCRHVAAPRRTKDLQHRQQALRAFEIPTTWSDGIRFRRFHAYPVGNDH